MTSSFLAGDTRQTLDHFRRSVDQLFENFYGFPRKPGDQCRAAASGCSVPCWRPLGATPHLNLRAILPGVAQHDLKVSVQNNQLIIEGERKAPETLQEERADAACLWEVLRGSDAADGLNVDKLNCRLQDGILDIQIPVSEQMKPRQIQIQSGESRKSISA